MSMVTFPTEGRYKDACAEKQKNQTVVPMVRRTTNLLPDVFLKILIRRNIQAYAPVLQPLRFHLIAGTWDSRNDHIGERETFL